MLSRYACTDGQGQTKGVCIMTSRPRGVAVREGQKVLPGRVCVGSRETCTAEEKEGAGETRRVKEGLELLGGSLVTSPFLFSQTSKVIDLWQRGEEEGGGREGMTLRLQVYGAFAGGVVYSMSKDDLFEWEQSLLPCRISSVSSARSRMSTGKDEVELEKSAPALCITQVC